MNKYEELRKKYPDFYFSGFETELNSDEIKITYHFEINGLSEFSPCWIFPVIDKELSADALDIMAFNLGMVELVSYWKITCSPNVHINCGQLCEKQINWWKKLYFNGLGEFFYVNGIEADNSFMSITSSGKEYFPLEGDAPGSGVLIPVGGGKDSSVTIELLSEFTGGRTAYIINSRGATEATVTAAGLENNTCRVRRTLDKNMLELNKQGFLNGHTPFSALVAFSSLIAASLQGREFVTLSNESSANESTVSGSTVNHQYSKSFEFENDFVTYEKEFINSGVKYFSFLRPLSEYQIAMLFSRFEAYHDVFRSCNAGSKTDIWCGVCPKCLFVFLIMSPHISYNRLVEIFGRDMLNDEAMLEDFKKLTGLLPEKPFECVGERDEINFSICEAIKGFGGEKLPYLFEYYKGTELYEKYSNAENPYLTYYNEENLLNEEFDMILRKALGGKNNA